MRTLPPLKSYTTRAPRTAIPGAYEVSYSITFLDPREPGENGTIRVANAEDVYAARTVVEQYLRLEVHPGKMAAFRAYKVEPMYADIMVSKGRWWKLRRT